MRSRAERLAWPLIAALVAGCAADQVLPPAPVTAPDAAAAQASLPPEAGTPEGPSGTAGSGAPQGYDAVGQASWYGDEAAGRPTASGVPFAPDAITAAHRILPLGSYAEVTSLDTGRTILVAITDRGPSRADREIDLSVGAARALGTNGRPLAPVRVRAVTPSPADAAQLRAGQPASARFDTPEPVLRALRRQLLPSAAPAVAKPPPRSPRPLPAAAPAIEAGRFVVQVAAFSSEARAQALARTMQGRVVPGGALWRVRLGPFDDMASAQRARDAAAARGYGDATILAD